jgi:GTPase SAR1 family protein
MYKKQKQTNQEGNGQYTLSNWYNASGKIEDKYEQKRGDVLKHPSRVLVCGPSGSGKTRLAVNLVTDIFKWDRLYIFAPQLDQFLFQRLVDYVSDEIASHGEEPEDYIYTSDTIDLTPEDLDPELQHLIIFDDLVSKYDSANNKKILQFAKKGRLRNCSMVVLTQSYHDTFPEIRENMSVLCIFDIKSLTDRSRIQATWCPELSKDEFKAIYTEAIKKREKDDPNAFLTIVKDEISKDRRYRRGLSTDTLYNKKGELIHRPEVSGKYPSSFPEENAFHRMRSPIYPPYFDDEDNSEEESVFDTHQLLRSLNDNVPKNKTSHQKLKLPQKYFD